MNWKRILAGACEATAVMLWATASYGQGATGVNPPVGSVWTYLGATYGAGWQPPGAFAAYQGCPSIISFGGAADGVTDNTPALTAAIQAQRTGAACISFPGGQFKFISPYNFTYPSTSFASLSLIGAGANVTQLIGPANASLFKFTFSQPFNSIHVSDLSLVTNNPCSTCTALAIVQSAAITAAGYSGQSTFTNVNIYGSDASQGFPSGVNYWETGIDDFGASNINFYGVYVQGLQNSSGPPTGSRGVYIHGDSTHVPVAFNFANTTLDLLDRGLDMGPYTQGITWVNGNSVGNNVSFYVSSLPGQGAAQLSIANSGSNACSNIYVPSTVAGAGNPIISYLMATNNVFISVGQPWPCGSFTTSVALGISSTYPIISDNVFSGASAWTGVSFSGPSYVAGKVVHNMFNGFGIAVDTTANPIADNSGGLIDGNTITTGNIGIRIGPRSFNYVVSNNILQGNTTDLQNNSGSTYLNAIDIPQTCQPMMLFGFGQIQLTGATWGGGQVTYTTASAHGVNVGDVFQIITTLPGGYNGQFTAVAGTTGSTLVAAMATNPGAATQLGYLFGSTNLTYSASSCVVTTIDRQVILEFDYTFSNLGTSAGTPVLAQLPNSSSAIVPSAGNSEINFAYSMTGLTGPITATIAPNTSQLVFGQWAPPSGTANITKTNFTNTTRLGGRVSFRGPSFINPPP